MIRIFVRHKVEDYPKWRKGYDAFENERKPMGVRGAAVFQSLDDPNDVTIWHDFDDRESAESFAGSQRLKDAMRNAGVQGQPQIWLVEQR